MKSEITGLRLELTHLEVIILRSIFDHIFSEDPYGEVSNHLSIDINKVVGVVADIEKALRMMLPPK